MLWFLLIITGAPCAAQISPGKLTLAHQAFNGPTKCTGCHSLASGKPSFKCLNCHAEIRSKVEAKTGFHGTVVKRDGGTKQECVRCHTDHYGENFKIVKWEPSRDDFDHRQTGYPLQGRHARVECAKCHRQDHIAKSDLVVIKIKDKTKTYLGLSERCSTCHVDEHRGQLGPDCARCHASLETWKQPSKFNHTAAKFQLTGLHQNVTCDKCHRPDLEAAAKPFVKYTNVPFASCADCHRDPHRGAFAGSCDSCHGDEGWKRLKTATGFDHSKTKFPLLGKHVKAACLDCHKTSNFKAPVEHEKCANCHQKDNPHKTQFAAQDCDACHTVDGYKPSTFTISRHQTSRYKLVGKHEIVECVKCHFPAGKDADYRPAYAACRDCHKDAHGGQFTKSYEDRCDTCHTEAGFKPSTFSITRHQKTKFALAGGHSATICVECHKPVENVYPLAPARFHFEDQSCMACHADPHRERLDAPAKTGCEVCHTTRAWKRVERFDHSTTGYTLTGAHRSVECKECHRTPVSSAASQRQLLFSGAPKKCAGCHEDIHGGQFATAKGEADCAACHVEIAWKPARFDHETRSKFSLAGAHRGVSCASCHTHRELVGSRVVIRYAAAPSRCAACHASR